MSAMKSVTGLFPSVASTSSVSAEVDDRRQQERERELQPEPVFKPAIVEPGVVVRITGISSKTLYHSLKSKLENYGPVRYLELSSDKRPRESRADGPPAKRARNEAKSDEKEPSASTATTGNEKVAVVSADGERPATVAESSKADGETMASAQAVAAGTVEAAGTTGGEAVASATVASGGTASGDAVASTTVEKAGTASGDAVASATVETTGTPSAVAAPVVTAESGKKNAADDDDDDDDEGDEDDDDAEDEDDVGDDEEQVPQISRCRFVDQAGAKAASEGFLEYDGAKLEVVILTGDDEQQFWDDTNKKLKERFDMKGKDKGKGKTKGKGKGKDKGKKGKGKDKGKKGKAK